MHDREEIKMLYTSIGRIALGSFLAGSLLAFTNYQNQPVADSTKFYTDKLACETKYAPGYDMFGNRKFGNIYKESPARDCMLAMGYKSL
jgi:hypothetical protein